MFDDPLATQLSRFTPDGAGLDRDVLLFAAGKASARPNHRWIAFAGALAASQVISLGIWLWPQPDVKTAGTNPLPRIEAPAESVTTPSSPSTMWALNLLYFAGDKQLPAWETVESMMPPEPPLLRLRPASRRAAALKNCPESSSLVLPR